MENSKEKLPDVKCFASGIDFRITNPDMFRAAMQLPLNCTAYSAYRGFELTNFKNKIYRIYDHGNTDPANTIIESIAKVK
jgi:hypothetical protein